MLLVLITILGTVFGVRDSRKVAVAAVETKEKGLSTMQTIHKWTVDVPTTLPASTTIRVPHDVMILSAKEQQKKISIWGITSKPSAPDAAKKDLPVRLVGTGDKLADSFSNDFRFIDTLIFRDGTHVVHVYVER
jgi:hypothetical protein